MKREQYKNFIMQTLLGNGGSMERQEVIRKFEGKFLHGSGRVYLRPEELGDRGTDTRWGNELSWARNELKDNGLLKNNSPNGLWELTRGGEKAASKLPCDDFVLYADAPPVVAEAVSKIADPAMKQKVIHALFGFVEQGVA